jgi:hypothetical protein
MKRHLLLNVQGRGPPDSEARNVIDEKRGAGVPANLEINRTRDVQAKKRDYDRGPKPSLKNENLIQ